MTENEYRKKAMEEADKVKSTEELVAFVEGVLNRPHDYGTIVVGMAAAMKATFKVINSTEQGGITGFQAGALGWELVREFMGITGSAKILDYSKMLWPQGEEDFARTISRETHTWLVEKAKENLEEHRETAHEDVIKHWEMLAEGGVPFDFTVTKH